MFEFGLRRQHHDVLLAESRELGVRVIKLLSFIALVYLAIDTVYFWDLQSKSHNIVNIAKLTAMFMLGAITLMPFARGHGTYVLMMSGFFVGFSVIIVAIRYLLPQHPHWIVLAAILSLVSAVVSLSRVQIITLQGIIAVPIMSFIAVETTATPEYRVSLIFLLALVVGISVAVFSVISRIREQYYELFRKLTEMATVDELSGLLNRRALNEHLSYELEKIARFRADLCVVIADIDYFKRINDNFGHDVGDKVIRHFSDLVKMTIRKTDRAYRIGGEEFLILCPNTTLAGAEILANRLREALKRSNGKLPGGLDDYTVSFGIAAADPRSRAEVEFSDLLRRADQALYIAKSAGRDRVRLFQADAGAVPNPS